MNTMKILLVVMKERRAIIDHLYESIVHANPECDVLRLSSEEQDNLDDYFSANIRIENYDRIVFALRSKKIFQQKAFFQKIDNLVFFEYDAWQNYVNVKNRGKFAQLYRAVPWARVIVSGYMLARRLQEDGFDAVFVPKGFDDKQLENLGLERNIELGFVGSTNNSIYTDRVKHLEKISQREPLVLARTNSAEEYREKLNRIKYFVSADLGFNEYMLKNFEAMACGCVVLAFNHGSDENQALEFRDMENIVLYRTIDELSEKLNILRTSPELVKTIAENGKKLAKQRYAFSVLGPKIVAALQPAMRSKAEFPPKNTGIREIINRLMRR